MPMSSSLAIVTQSEAMRAVLARVDTIAGSDTSVLLVGETGVGKELFADYIHRVSPRANRPLVKIALSAMPHDLLESELFGHERGAFTNAITDKAGLFELAHTGTLFLDDIDDVPPAGAGQAAARPRVTPGDARGRTHHDPGRRPADHRVQGRPRGTRAAQRLPRRTSSIASTSARWRFRRCAIGGRTCRCSRRISSAASRGNKTLVLSPAAERAMVKYDWPGNVRELRNIIQRLALVRRRRDPAR